MNSSYVSRRRSYPPVNSRQNEHSRHLDRKTCNSLDDSIVYRTSGARLLRRPASQEPTTLHPGLSPAPREPSESLRASTCSPAGMAESGRIWHSSRSFARSLRRKPAISLPQPRPPGDDSANSTKSKHSSTFRTCTSSHGNQRRRARQDRTSPSPAAAPRRPRAAHPTDAGRWSRPALNLFARHPAVSAVTEAVFCPYNSAARAGGAECQECRVGRARPGGARWPCP
jgi:hypothetical protein